MLLAAWQLGRLCLSRVTFERRLDAVLFACGVGVVALASVLLVLARGGFYRPAAVAATVLLAAAVRPVGLWSDAASLLRWNPQRGGGSRVARTRPDVRHNRRGRARVSAIAALHSPKPSTTRCGITSRSRTNGSRTGA